VTSSIAGKCVKPLGYVNRQIYGSPYVEALGYILIAITVFRKSIQHIYINHPGARLCPLKANEDTEVLII